MSSNIAFCGVSETIDKSREILKTLQASAFEMFTILHICFILFIFKQ